MTVFDAIGQNLTNFSAGQGLKKSLEDKRNEKTKIYNYIGMEVYDLYRKNGFRQDELNIYFEKLTQLDEEIKAVEEEMERLSSTSKSMRCSCGTNLTDGMKFCPKCGKMIENSEFTCKCGRMIKKDMKFCPGCGQNVSELMNTKEAQSEILVEENEVEVKKCICGAQIVAGQSICMECGRMVVN